MNKPTRITVAEMLEFTTWVQGVFEQLKAGAVTFDERVALIELGFERTKLQRAELQRDYKETTPVLCRKDDVAWLKSLHEKQDTREDKK